ncbi:hypothetical protein BJX76DRAFT_3519 [Aspergillus varians]
MALCIFTFVSSALPHLFSLTPYIPHFPVRLFSFDFSFFLGIEIHIFFVFSSNRQGNIKHVFSTHFSGSSLSTFYFTFFFLYMYLLSPWVFRGNVLGVSGDNHAAWLASSS